MAQHARVPKFGNWEGDGNVPYTQYFENARKGRGGEKLINPNDPQQNPNAFPEGVAASHASIRNASESEFPKTRYEQHTRREDGDFRLLSDSLAHKYAVGRKPGTDVSNQQREEWMNSNDQRRTSRMSGGSEHSIDSPLHAHYQVKLASKGGVSPPTWERKDSSEAGHGFAPSPSTPGKSKLRPAGRRDQRADKGSTVPKFGDWDESNPSSADGYSHIFNKVREEKQGGAAKVPIVNTDPVYNDIHRQGGGHYDSSSCSCFGWCRK